MILTKSVGQQVALPAWFHLSIVSRDYNFIEILSVLFITTLHNMQCIIGNFNDKLGWSQPNGCVFFNLLFTIIWRNILRSIFFSPSFAAETSWLRRLFAFRIVFEMLPQTRGSCESLLTIVAKERLQAWVYSFVVLQAALRSEPFATLGARKRSFSCVGSHVNRKVCLASIPEHWKF